MDEELLVQLADKDEELLVQLADKDDESKRDEIWWMTEEDYKLLDDEEQCMEQCLQQYGKDSEHVDEMDELVKKYQIQKQNNLEWKLQIEKLEQEPMVAEASTKTLMESTEIHNKQQNERKQQSIASDINSRDTFVHFNGWKGPLHTDQSSKNTNTNTDKEKELGDINCVKNSCVQNERKQGGQQD